MPNPEGNTSNHHNNMLRAAMSAGAAVLAAGTVFVARHNDAPQSRTPNDHPSADQIAVVAETPREIDDKPASASAPSTSDSGTEAPLPLLPENSEHQSPQPAHNFKQKTPEQPKESGEAPLIELPETDNEDATGNEHPPIAYPDKTGQEEAAPEADTLNIQPDQAAPVAEEESARPLSPWELAEKNFRMNIWNPSFDRQRITGTVKLEDKQQSFFVSNPAAYHDQDTDIVILAWRNEEAPEDLAVYAVESKYLPQAITVYGENDTAPLTEDIKGKVEPLAEENQFITEEGQKFGQFRTDITEIEGQAYIVSIENNQFKIEKPSSAPEQSAAVEPVEP